MSKKYFKEYVHTYKTYILRKSKTIADKTFPANSIVVIDEYHNYWHESYDMYVCCNLPHTYKGDNPVLTVFVLSEGETSWDCMTIQNHITKRLFKAFTYNKRRMAKFGKLEVSDSAAAELMKAEHKKKKSVGGKIYTNQITDSIGYNQLTEYAYWANLDNAKSGCAALSAVKMIGNY